MHPTKLTLISVASSRLPLCSFPFLFVDQQETLECRGRTWLTSYGSTVLYRLNLWNDSYLDICGPCSTFRLCLSSVHLQWQPSRILSLCTLFGYQCNLYSCHTMHRPKPSNTVIHLFFITSLCFLHFWKWIYIHRIFPSYLLHSLSRCSRLPSGWQAPTSQLSRKKSLKLLSKYAAVSCSYQRVEFSALVSSRFGYICLL